MRHSRGLSFPCISRLTPGAIGQGRGEGDILAAEEGQSARGFQGPGPFSDWVKTG